MTPTTHPKLAWHDLQWCLRRMPRQVLVLMKRHGSKVFVAGGFIRSCIAQERVNDVDLFVESKDIGKQLALELAEGDEKRVHYTDNAYSVKGLGIFVQFIHRWTFKEPAACIESFDFTVAKAAFWFEQTPDGDVCDKAGKIIGRWASLADARFYPDLAGKRLVYCSPIRNEDAGGSMLRVLKFYQRGYRMPIDSLGAVISRLVQGVDPESYAMRSEHQMAKVLTGLLREVDPNVDPTHIAHLPAEKVDGSDESPEEPSDQS